MSKCKPMQSDCNQCVNFAASTPMSRRGRAAIAPLRINLYLAAASGTASRLPACACLRLCAGTFQRF